jgi:hypothetical protein
MIAEGKDMLFQGKTKKAMSVIIGYVLLVSFALVIGVIVFQWMKTYVPQDDINCPDGVSLLIESYDCSSNILTLNLKNNGKFNINAYYIYATDSPNEELAIIDLSKNNTDYDISKLLPTGIRFGQIGVDDFLAPNDVETETYNLVGISNLDSIEIIPLRLQEQKNRNIWVSCKDVKIREKIECS